MKKIKIAQIGTSRYSHGTVIFEAMRKNSDLFEVAGYALPEEEREKFPEQMGAFAGAQEMTIEEILTDPTITAVAVETEEIYLTKYARLAAQHGKHIHMEKPGGLSPVAFEALVDDMETQKKVLHLGYMYRYNPCLTEIFARIRAGEIGRVISVEAQMSGWRDEAMTRWLETFPGGMMFYLGCHLVDLVLRLQGEPKRILPFNKSTGVYDTSAKDFSMALFEYENGVSFIKTTQTERGGFLRRQLVITGEKGKFEVRPLEINVGYPLQRTEYRRNLSEDWNDEGETFRSAPYDRYDAMLRAFAEMAAGEKENPYSYDYERLLYKTLLRCCE